MNAPAPTRHSPAANGRRQRTRSARPALSAPTPCPIFILYGNVHDARDAVLRVTKLLRPDQSARGLLPMFWRFDQLAGARMREMALRDAGRAEALVLALGRESELDPATDAWLGELARQRRGTPTHVLTLMGDDAWTISLEEAQGERPAPAQRKTSAAGPKIAAPTAAFAGRDIAAAA